MDESTLRSIELFESLSEAARRTIAQHAEELDVPEGTDLARQGEFAYEFFVIQEGSAEVLRDGQHIADLGPGDFFGELSVLDGRPRTAQVVATGPTSCLALSTWDFEAVVHDQPSVAMAILRGLAGRLRDLTEADRH